MKYTLVYTARAVSDVRSFDAVVRKKLSKKLLGLAHDPKRKSKKLSDPKLGTYRYRIGDYRIIFDVVGQKIVVLRIGHRKDIDR